MPAIIVPYPTNAETIQRLQSIGRRDRGNIALLEQRLERERLRLLVEITRERIAHALHAREPQGPSGARAAAALCLADIDRLSQRLGRSEGAVAMQGDAFPAADDRPSDRLPRKRPEWRRKAATKLPVPRS